MSLWSDLSVDEAELQQLAVNNFLLVGFHLVEIPIYAKIAAVEIVGLGSSKVQ